MLPANRYTVNNTVILPTHKIQRPKITAHPRVNESVWIHFGNVKWKDGYRITRETEGCTAGKLSQYICKQCRTSYKFVFHHSPWHGEHFSKGQRRLWVLPFSHLGPGVQLSELKAGRTLKHCTKVMTWYRKQLFLLSQEDGGWPFDTYFICGTWVYKGTSLSDSHEIPEELWGL